MKADEIELGQVIDVGASALIVIHDTWSGDNPHAPIVASYQLRRGAGGIFEGTGVLSTGLVAARKVKVQIPRSTARRFLGALSNVAICAGPYHPLQECTDDYPHIEIALYVPTEEIGRAGGLLTLYTESQGEFHAPWAALVGGKAYTSDGDAVGRALKGLTRALRRRELDRMMREAERRPFRVRR